MFDLFGSFKKIPLPFFNSFDIYLDFGTTNTKIAVKDKGVVLNEPSFLGFNTKTREYIFFGHEAKNIVGKTPEFIKITQPIVNSVISDFDAEVSLIKNFFEKAINVYLKKYQLVKTNFRAISTVPYSTTEIEKKAVEEVLFKMGFSDVFLIDKPIANAAGANINVFSHHPNLIVDLGGGLVEAAITSGGGVVNEKNIKSAGENMNHLIANYVYLKHGIILGENTCELIKINLLNFTNSEKIITVRGKSLETGLPKSIRLKSSEIKESLTVNFSQIIDIIKELIEISPPEVVDDIYDQGIILCGGLVNIPGIEKYFASELKIDVIKTKSPAETTVVGLLSLGKNFENITRLSLPKM
jgi:rod shape-determining protein MreB